MGVLINKRWPIKIVVFIFVLVSFQNCVPSDHKEGKTVLFIAVAANTLETMRILADSFYLKTDVRIELIQGSSGKLTTQITQLAPYSMFFSADEYYPNFLHNEGFASSKPIIYAQGYLTMWVRDVKINNDSINFILSDEKVKKIAIANIMTAPYGKVVYSWLRNKEILKDIEHKLVFGESIAQVNTYIMSSTVDIAFTSLSSFSSNNPITKGHFMDLPVDEYPPIKQAVIITKFGEKNFPEETLSFLNFVRSENGKAILKRQGYSCFGTVK